MSAKQVKTTRSAHSVSQRHRHMPLTNSKSREATGSLKRRRRETSPITAATAAPSNGGLLTRAASASTYDQSYAYRTVRYDLVELWYRQPPYVECENPQPEHLEIPRFEFPDLEYEKSKRFRRQKRQRPCASRSVEHEVRVERQEETKHIKENAIDIHLEKSELGAKSASQTIVTERQSSCSKSTTCQHSSGGIDTSEIRKGLLLAHLEPNAEEPIETQPPEPAKTQVVVTGMHSIVLDAEPSESSSAFSSPQSPLVQRASVTSNPMVIEMLVDSGEEGPIREVFDLKEDDEEYEIKGLSPPLENSEDDEVADEAVVPHQECSSSSSESDGEEEEMLDYPLRVVDSTIALSGIQVTQTSYLAGGASLTPTAREDESATPPMMSQTISLGTMLHSADFQALRSSDEDRLESKERSDNAEPEPPSSETDIRNEFRDISESSLHDARRRKSEALEEAVGEIAAGGLDVQDHLPTPPSQGLTIVADDVRPLECLSARGDEAVKNTFAEKPLIGHEAVEGAYEESCSSLEKALDTHEVQATTLHPDEQHPISTEGEEFRADASESELKESRTDDVMSGTQFAESLRADSRESRSDTDSSSSNAPEAASGRPRASHASVSSSSSSERPDTKENALQCGRAQTTPRQYVGQKNLSLSGSDVKSSHSDMSARADEEAQREIVRSVAGRSAYSSAADEATQVELLAQSLPNDLVGNTFRPQQGTGDMMATSEVTTTLEAGAIEPSFELLTLSSFAAPSRESSLSRSSLILRKQGEEKESHYQCPQKSLTAALETTLPSSAVSAAAERRSEQLDLKTSSPVEISEEEKSSVDDADSKAHNVHARPSPSLEGMVPPQGIDEILENHTESAVTANTMQDASGVSTDSYESQRDIDDTLIADSLPSSSETESLKTRSVSLSSTAPLCAKDSLSVIAANAISDACEAELRVSEKLTAHQGKKDTNRQPSSEVSNFERSIVVDFGHHDHTNRKQGLPSYIAEILENEPELVTDEDVQKFKAFRDVSRTTAGEEGRGVTQLTASPQQDIGKKIQDTIIMSAGHTTILASCTSKAVEILEASLPTSGVPEHTTRCDVGSANTVQGDLGRSEAIELKSSDDAPFGGETKPLQTCNGELSEDTERGATHSTSRNFIGDQATGALHTSSYTEDGEAEIETTSSATAKQVSSAALAAEEHKCVPQSSSEDLLTKPSTARSHSVISKCEEKRADFSSFEGATTPPDDAKHTQILEALHCHSRAPANKVNDSFGTLVSSRGTFADSTSLEGEDQTELLQAKLVQNAPTEASKEQPNVHTLTRHNEHENTALSISLKGSFEADTSQRGTVSHSSPSVEQVASHTCEQTTILSDCLKEGSGTAIDKALASAKEDLQLVSTSPLCNQIINSSLEETIMVEAPASEIGSSEEIFTTEIVCEDTNRTFTRLDERSVVIQPAVPAGELKTCDSIVSIIERLTDDLPSNNDESQPKIQREGRQSDDLRTSGDRETADAFSKEYIPQELNKEGMITTALLSPEKVEPSAAAPTVTSLAVTAIVASSEEERASVCQPSGEGISESRPFSVEWTMSTAAPLVSVVAEEADGQLEDASGHEEVLLVREVASLERHRMMEVSDCVQLHTESPFIHAVDEETYATHNPSRSLLLGKKQAQMIDHGASLTADLASLDVVKVAGHFSVQASSAVEVEDHFSNSQSDFRTESSEACSHLAASEGDEHDGLSEGAGRSSCQRAADLISSEEVGAIYVEAESEGTSDCSSSLSASDESAEKTSSSSSSMNSQNGEHTLKVETTELTLAENIEAEESPVTMTRLSMHREKSLSTPTEGSSESEGPQRISRSWSSSVADNTAQHASAPSLGCSDTPEESSDTAPDESGVSKSDAEHAQQHSMPSRSSDHISEDLASSVSEDTVDAHRSQASVPSAPGAVESVIPKTPTGSIVPVSDAERAATGFETFEEVPDTPNSMISMTPSPTDKLDHLDVEGRTLDESPERRQRQDRQRLSGDTIIVEAGDDEDYPTDNFLPRTRKKALITTTTVLPLQTGAPSVAELTTTTTVVTTMVTSNEPKETLTDNGSGGERFDLSPTAELISGNASVAVIVEEAESHSETASTHEQALVTEGETDSNSGSIGESKDQYPRVYPTHQDKRTDCAPCTTSSIAAEETQSADRILPAVALQASAALLQMQKPSAVPQATSDDSLTESLEADSQSAGREEEDRDVRFAVDNRPSSQGAEQKTPKEGGSHDAGMEEDDATHSLQTSNSPTGTAEDSSPDPSPSDAQVHIGETFIDIIQNASAEETETEQTLWTVHQPTDHDATDLAPPSLCSPVVIVSTTSPAEAVVSSDALECDSDLSDDVLASVPNAEGDPSDSQSPESMSAAQDCDNLASLAVSEVMIKTQAYPPESPVGTITTESSVQETSCVTTDQDTQMKIAAIEPAASADLREVSDSATLKSKTDTKDKTSSDVHSRKKGDKQRCPSSDLSIAEGAGDGDSAPSDAYQRTNEDARISPMTISPPKIDTSVAEGANATVTTVMPSNFISTDAMLLVNVINEEAERLSAEVEASPHRAAYVSSDLQDGGTGCAREISTAHHVGGEGHESCSFTSKTSRATYEPARAENGVPVGAVEASSGTRGLDRQRSLPHSDSDSLIGPNEIASSTFSEANTDESSASVIVEDDGEDDYSSDEMQTRVRKKAIITTTTIIPPQPKPSSSVEPTTTTTTITTMITSSNPRKGPQRASKASASARPSAPRAPVETDESPSAPVIVEEADSHSEEELSTTHDGALVVQHEATLEGPDTERLAYERVVEETIRVAYTKGGELPPISDSSSAFDDSPSTASCSEESLLESSVDDNRGAVHEQETLNMVKRGTDTALPESLAARDNKHSQRGTPSLSSSVSASNSLASGVELEAADNPEDCVDVNAESAVKRQDKAGYGGGGIQDITEEPHLEVSVTSASEEVSSSLLSSSESEETESGMIGEPDILTHLNASVTSLGEVHLPYSGILTASPDEAFVEESAGSASCVESESSDDMSEESLDALSTSSVAHEVLHGTFDDKSHLSSASDGLSSSSTDDEHIEETHETIEITVVEQIRTEHVIEEEPSSTLITSSDEPWSDGSLTSSSSSDTSEDSILEEAEQATALSIVQEVNCEISEVQKNYEIMETTLYRLQKHAHAHSIESSEFDTSQEGETLADGNVGQTLVSSSSTFGGRKSLDEDLVGTPRQPRPSGVMEERVEETSSYTKVTEVVQEVKRTNSSLSSSSSSSYEDESESEFSTSSEEVIVTRAEIIYSPTPTASVQNQTQSSVVGVEVGVLTRPQYSTSEEPSSDTDTSSDASTPTYCERIEVAITETSESRIVLQTEKPAEVILEHLSESSDLFDSSNDTQDSSDKESSKSDRLDSETTDLDGRASRHASESLLDTKMKLEAQTKLALVEEEGPVGEEEEKGFIDAFSAAQSASSLAGTTREKDFSEDSVTQLASINNQSLELIGEASSISDSLSVTSSSSSNHLSEAYHPKEHMLEQTISSVTSIEEDTKVSDKTLSDKTYSSASTDVHITSSSTDVAATKIREDQTRLEHYQPISAVKTEGRQTVRVDSTLSSNPMPALPSAGIGTQSQQVDQFAEETHLETSSNLNGVERRPTETLLSTSSSSIQVATESQDPEQPMRESHTQIASVDEESEAEFSGDNSPSDSLSSTSSATSLELPDTSQPPSSSAKNTQAKNIVVKEDCLKDSSFSALVLLTDTHQLEETRVETQTQLASVKEESMTDLSEEEPANHLQCATSCASSLAAVERREEKYVDSAESAQTANIDKQASLNDATDDRFNHGLGSFRIHEVDDAGKEVAPAETSISFPRASDPSTSTSPSAEKDYVPDGALDVTTHVVQTVHTTTTYPKQVSESQPINLGDLPTVTTYTVVEEPIPQVEFPEGAQPVYRSVLVYLTADKKRHLCVHCARQMRLAPLRHAGTMTKRSWCEDIEGVLESEKVDKRVTIRHARPPRVPCRDVTGDASDDEGTISSSEDYSSMRRQDTGRRARILEEVEERVLVETEEALIELKSKGVQVLCEELESGVTQVIGIDSGTQTDITAAAIENRYEGEQTEFEGRCIEDEQEILHADMVELQRDCDSRLEREIQKLVNSETYKPSRVAVGYGSHKHTHQHAHLHTHTHQQQFNVEAFPPVVPYLQARTLNSRDGGLRQDECLSLSSAASSRYQNTPKSPSRRLITGESESSSTSSALQGAASTTSNGHQRIISRVDAHKAFRQKSLTLSKSSLS